MAKVKVKVNTDRFIKSIKSDYQKFVADKSIPNNMGLFLVERIRGETRRGKPFNDTRSFPELKDPPTPQIRAALKNITILIRRCDPDFQPLHLQASSWMDLSIRLGDSQCY